MAPAASPTPAPREPGSVGSVQTQYADLPRPLALDSGRSLWPVRIAYETYGTLAPQRDNVILVCHALSGDAHAAGWSEGDAPSAVDGIGADERGIKPRGGLGWWDGMIGPGKAFDTDRFFVVCANLLGGCRGTTGPSSINPATGHPYGARFPVVTVGDMVRAQRSLLVDVLGIERLAAISGGSLGGMLALEWSLAYPDAVQACIPIATTARLGSQGVAWNAIARNAIMADPAWQGGDYYGTEGPRAGISVARMVGHVTYLSAEAMSDKFGRRLQERDAYSYSLDTPDFAVESYLRHQGETFAARFDANSYLYLSRALTYFDLALTRGEGSLERAFAQARARYLLISYSSDWLYPPADSAEIANAARAAGCEVERHVIETTYGHDSFLLEEARQAQLISNFLAREPEAALASTGAGHGSA